MTIRDSKSTPQALSSKSKFRFSFQSASTKHVLYLLFRIFDFRIQKPCSRYCHPEPGSTMSSCQSVYLVRARPFFVDRTRSQTQFPSQSRRRLFKFRHLLRSSRLLAKWSQVLNWFSHLRRVIQQDGICECSECVGFTDVESGGTATFERALVIASSTFSS